MDLFFRSSFIILFFVFGCATDSKIRITSSPEKAEVKVTTNDGESKSLGVTPLEISGRDVYANASRMSVLHISKEGFETQNLFIAQENNIENYNINVKLKTKTEDVKGQDIKQRQEKLAKGIAMSHHLISKKRFEEAERVLTGITNDYPYVSVPYDLLGNISYLQRDFRAALGYYERSYQINPENAETKSMIDKLKQMTN